MVQRIRAHDWAATPLGPLAVWPDRLKLIVELMLASPLVSTLTCGPQHLLIYNDTAALLFGDHHPGALGRSLSEAFPQGWATVAPFYARALAGETVQVGSQPLDTRGDNGAMDVFDALLAPVRESDGRVAYVHMTGAEVGDRSRIETALRESETRHRLLIESLAQAEWETDAAGVVVADSPSWRAYTGQTVEALLGYGWLDAIHPADRTYAERQWREAMEARGHVNAEFRLRAPNGGWRWTNVRAAPVLDAAGEIRKWAGMNINIDARRRAEAALRESEAKLRTVFDSIDEGFLIHEIIRDENGRPIDIRMLEANPAFLRLTGFSQELIGKPQRAIMPDLEQVWIDTFDRVARTGVPERFENFNQPTGRWYSVHISQVIGRDDQVAVVFDDVTTRKRSEILLRESEERQAFLLKLSDAIRPLDQPGNIADVACRLLVEHLSVSQAQYASLTGEAGAEQGEVFGEYKAAGEPLPRQSPLLPFGEPILQSLRDGKTVELRDAGTDDRLGPEQRLAFAAVDAGAVVSVPLVKHGRWTAALTVQQDAARDWFRRDVTLVEDVAERTWAAIERALEKAALRASERRFAEFAKASSAGLWIRDAATLSMDYVSPALLRIYGVEPDAILGKVEKWAAVIVPEDRDTALAHIAEARQGEAVTHEFRIQRPSDRTFRWIRSTNFPLEVNGHVQRIGGIAEDVTEAKLAAEHSAVLLAELQHRVRNIMALLRSITKRTADCAESVPEYRDLMMGRLLAFARVQALLTRTASVSVGMASIVHDEVSAQAQHEGQYMLVGPDVALSPKAAEVMTLAIHELATNAVKYGALSVPTGRVTVRWSTFETRGGPWLAFDWTEEGATASVQPTPDAPRRRGFGSELIEGRIPYELKGHGQVTIGPAGARCRLEFPLQEDGASILETGAPQRATMFGGTIERSSRTGAPMRS